MNDIETMNKTARTRGAVGPNAVVPKQVRAHVTDLVNSGRFMDKSGPDVLDYGAGPESIHARALCDEGYQVTAYDIGNNVDLDFKYNEPLKHKYDIVYASNVLNVQMTIDLLDSMLEEVHSVLRDSGVFIANYPRSPRKGVMQHIDIPTLTRELKKWFGSVERSGFTFKCYR